MPELPDITVYVERLERLTQGAVLEGVRLASPFLLRSVDPPIGAAAGKAVRGVRRVGKRVVFALDDELFLVIHLMIAGRLQWRPRGARIPGRVGVAAFDFSTGTLTMTEASQKKRASLHLVRGEAALAEHDPGGIDVFTADGAAFTAALRAERHTLKRTLTDPRTFSGIGNAYSDEILHRAKLSPVLMSTALDDEQALRLYEATRSVLAEWTERLRHDDEDKPLPEKVTAFRPEMAVHGKAGQPCPVCGSPVQRIAYADNETNYCATCQTGGKLLADRALSRLMKEDWPRTLDELEALKKQHRAT
jgi:formamidopyrimidine-DNA glycosylase